MALRIYGVLPSFDLFIEASCGQGQIAGMAVNGEPIPLLATGAYGKNLGLGAGYSHKPFDVFVDVIKTSPSDKAYVTVSLYQKVPLDAAGNPVLPIPNPDFKLNPWTFDAVEIDLPASNNPCTIPITLI